MLSQGRLDLGVGVGWQREEFEAEGLDFEARGALLTDTLAACRALWRDTPGELPLEDGVASSASGASRSPIQPGGPPVWFSGTLTPRNVARIVTLGDGWIPIMTATRDDLADGRAPAAQSARRRRPRSADAARARQPRAWCAAPIGARDLARTLAGAHELAAAGATDVQLPLLAFVRAPEALPDFFAELALLARDQAGGAARRNGRAMKVLVMGGTQFNGLALVRELVRYGPRRDGLQPRQDAGRAAAGRVAAWSPIAPTRLRCARRSRAATGTACTTSAPTAPRTRSA